MVRVVELLYFAACPGWTATRDLLHDVVRAHALVDVEIRLVAVEDAAAAQQLRFSGSPSVRVDGVDIAPLPAEDGYALRCRVYPVDGQLRGAPPRALIAAALGVTDVAR